MTGRDVRDSLRPLSSAVTLLPRRDIEFERRFTREAGDLGRVNVEALIALSDGRAGMAPVREIATRDFGRECLEELSDTRNYCDWFAVQAYLDPNPDGELIALVASGLQHTARAFEDLGRARLRWKGI